MLVPLLLSCAEPPAPPRDPPAPFAVASPAFSDGQPLPAEHGCGGPSPPLSWSGLPAATAALAVVVEGADGTTFWTAWNIDIQGALAAGVHPADPPLQGMNAWGTVGWHGPCDEPARIAFRVFALERPLADPPTASRARLDASIADRAIGAGVLTATWAKTP